MADRAEWQATWLQAKNPQTNSRTAAVEAETQQTTGTTDSTRDTIANGERFNQLARKPGTKGWWPEMISPQGNPGSKVVQSQQNLVHFAQ